MAKPYLKRGAWYARVKDEAGRWRAVALPEAKTRKRAVELSTRSRGSCGPPTRA